jgi:hypothetical protein
MVTIDYFFDNFKRQKYEWRQTWEEKLKKSFEIELEWIIGEEQSDGATIL